MKKSKIASNLILCCCSVFQLVMYAVIVISSSGMVETNASLVTDGVNLNGQYSSTVKCTTPTLSFQVKWDEVDTVCHVTLQDRKGQDVINTYFTTNDGKHFRHCHAEYEPLILPQHTTCFNMGYPDFMWRELTIRGVPQGSRFLKVEDEHMRRYECYQKKGSNHNQIIVAKTYIPFHWALQKVCQIEDKAGFYDASPNMIRLTAGMGMSTLNATDTEECDTYNLNGKVDWRHVRLVCLHFKTHYGNSIVNAYFGGKRNNGNFRHCYSAQDLVGNYNPRCFPGKWSHERWEKVSFPNGELYGETDLLSLDSWNVRCFARKIAQTSVTSESTVKEWYADQPGCGYYDPAGFYKS